MKRKNNRSDQIQNWVHPTPMKVTIVEGYGTDVIMIQYDAPSACWPFDEEDLHMKFEAAKGTGAEYVERVFGVKAKVIETTVK